MNTTFVEKANNVVKFTVEVDGATLKKVLFMLIIATKIELLYQDFEKEKHQEN